MATSTSSSRREIFQSCTNLTFARRFFISLEELQDGEDVAHCPSCTLKIRVIYDDDFLEKVMARLSATPAPETE